MSTKCSRAEAVGNVIGLWTCKTKVFDGGGHQSHLTTDRITLTLTHVMDLGILSNSHDSDL